MIHSLVGEIKSITPGMPKWITLTASDRIVIDGFQRYEVRVVDQFRQLETDPVRENIRGAIMVANVDDPLRQAIDLVSVLLLVIKQADSITGNGKFTVLDIVDLPV